MADKKISELTASTTPLAGTEVLPVVQAGVTKKVSAENIATATRPSGVANGVTFLNGSKIPSSNANLIYDGSVVKTEVNNSTVYSATGSGVVPATGTLSNLVNSNATTGATAFQTFQVAGASGSGFFYHGLVGEGTSTTGRYVIGRRSGSSAYAELYSLEANGDVRARLGNFVVGTAGKGIDFSGAGTAAKILDDYEEGTWNPSLIGGAGASGQTYTRINGHYTKIGRQVTCTFEVQLAAKGTVSGSALISGLPFTVGNSRRNRNGCPFGLVTNTGQSVVSVQGQVAENTNICSIRVRTAASTSDLAPIADDFFTDTTAIVGTITYFTD